jgi:hypothetical protein
MDDLISRQQAIDALDCIGGVEEVLRSLPTIQTVATDINVGDTISRKPAIDALDKQIKQCCKALGSLSLSDIDKHAVEVEMASLSAYREMLENLPTAQPEPTDEQVEDYCKKRDLHLVTYDLFQSIRLDHKVSFCDKDHVWIDGKQYISLRRFQEAVKEAQPKEGYWKKDEKDDCPPVFRRFRICSVCGAIETSETSYCPNCGAKMKGAEHETN